MAEGCVTGHLVGRVKYTSSNIIQRRYVSNKGYTNYICVYVYIYIVKGNCTVVSCDMSSITHVHSSA